jgi:Zn-dependent M28 family amino/carboxypeptidase
MKNKMRIKTLLTLVINLISFVLFSQNITVDVIKPHISYLADDKLQGREPGTKGEKLAIKYISQQFKSYGLKQMGSKGYAQPFTYKTKKSPHDTVATGEAKNGSNVIGFLDNGAAKTIVIGGHFDHLGFREHGSSLDKNKKLIHNGADDNASGTAGVLALANYFANNGIKEKSNFLFMCYSAEEDGLIGSKYFTNNPTMDLTKISAMINMDMIGRLNDSTKKLMVFGVGTSPAYTNIFANTKTNLTLGFDSSGIGPSDQTSFYLKNIPVLHFFTGQHTDYHKSTDDTEKINFAGEVEVLQFIQQIAAALAETENIPFTKTKQPEQARVSFKVTLGIMPDYSFEGKGVKIDAINEGKPAILAGMQAGDVLIQLGEFTVNNMQDYMKALSKHSKGQQVQATVLRGGNPVNLSVTF